MNNQSSSNASNNNNKQQQGRSGSSYGSDVDKNKGRSQGQSLDQSSGDQEGGHLEQLVDFVKANWKTVLSELVAAGVTTYLAYSAKEKEKAAAAKRQ